MICHQQSPAPINLSCSLASTNSNGNTAQFTTSSQPPSPPPLLVGRLRFRLICIFALAPPVAGILGVLGLALWLHSDLLFGYEWSCGIAYLPSVSRVLNLPAERILWNFVICLHFPLRFLITSHYYLSFRFGTRPHQHQTAGTIESQSKPKSKCSLSAEQYLRTVFLLSGLADHVFLLCLSIVGERENAELHVIFFSGFLFSTFIHFTAHFYLENSIEFPGKGKRFRMLLLALLWLLIPVIVICFSLHELYCTKFSYESFVLGEYLTVATIFGLNSIILYDRHPNCEYFTIRVSVS